MFKEIDHIAIAVKDTEEALGFYRDQLGLEVVGGETFWKEGVRLTHLDMGNVVLQLVQPLRKNHPLSDYLARHGEGLHHLCWKTGDITTGMASLKEFGLEANPNEPHPGVSGNKAAFINPAGTRGVLWEITGPQGMGGSVQ